MESMIAVSVWNQDAAKPFFDAQGMTYHFGLEKQIFLIELREKPSILTRLEAAGYFSRDNKRVWEMLSITDNGLTIYLANREAGDGYVFIPLNNVLAIHTVNENWLNAVRIDNTNNAQDA